MTYQYITNKVKLLTFSASSLHPRVMHDFMYILNSLLVYDFYLQQSIKMSNFVVAHYAREYFFQYLII